jgi:YegS/Rv2252/BmrU family lipid kinase
VQINATLYSWQIIMNPNALLHRSSRFWEHIAQRLREVQINYLHHETSTVDEAKELIINLCKQGERHFILVGGDGTINIFANAVMESQINSSEIFAALIPLGTGNDWSRSHGYSNRYLEAIDALVKGNFINHDIGLVETVVNDQVVAARYFVNIAGFGFDGAVISNASKKTTKIFHKQLYLINLLKTLLAYKSQLITLKSDDFTVAATIFSIAAGIGQYNGNGMCQCPDAVSDDGLLDVVIIEKVSILKVLLNIQNLFKGAHVKNLKEVSVYRTNCLEINTKPFILGEVEGEMLTTGNYRIRCLASAIHFMIAR